MAEFRTKLKNAPIREAVIDFRISPTSKRDRSVFDHFHDQISAEYAKCNDLHADSIELNLADRSSPVSSFQHSFCGLRCRSNDSRYVVQARNNGFTLSRLAPYDTWEELQSEARRLWQIYLDVVEPAAVTRVGVRYINRIGLKFEDGNLDLDDFFEYGLSTPDQFPQLYLNQLCQAKLLDERTGIVANVSLTTQKGEEGRLPVIFDIDVFKGGTYSLDDDSQWDILEELRAMKNRIFFGGITSKTLELID